MFVILTLILIIIVIIIIITITIIIISIIIIIISIIIIIIIMIIIIPCLDFGSSFTNFEKYHFLFPFFRYFPLVIFDVLRQ